jgi:TetR/AcrR family transcriptional regulator, transcriptional repressor for nem operon
VRTTKQKRTNDPEAMRQKILMAAFLEFYKNGFQGGSLNDILKAAGATKGALFHHFSGKQDLGYAVVDHVIGPLLMERWLAPIANVADPLTALQQSFRKYVNEDIASGHFVQGCPLNNLAQEMSPLDKGFHTRIDALYDQWRAAIAAALARGIEKGTVRSDVSPKNVGTLVVAGQMGIWGSGKSSQDKELMTQACEAMCDYLESLRPRATKH